MKGTSKVIMGATLVLVVSLAMVLGLILVLLAELYCSLLLRRRRRLGRANAAANTANAAVTATAAAASSSATPPSSQERSSDDHHRHHDHDFSPTAPLSSFYAQGVLQAPRSLLFPVVSSKEEEGKQQQPSELHHQVAIDIPNKQTEPTTIPTTTPSPSYTTTTSNDKHFVYISNPIYENAENGLSSTGPNTPFETPDSSPSRLEEMAGSGSGSSGEEEVGQSSPWSSSLTPPLTPMKKLPAEGSSVSLRDARSLATNSGSDSNSNNDGLSSSSSGSPSTSPSW